MAKIICPRCHKEGDKSQHRSICRACHNEEVKEKAREVKRKEKEDNE